MRLRFFLIILCALIVTTVSISYFHIYFFTNRPLSNLKKNMEESAIAIAKTSLATMPRGELKDVDELITKTLKKARVGKVFLLKEADGTLDYQSVEAKNLEMEFPLKEGWSSVENAAWFVPYYTASLPGPHHRYLQIGLLLDPNQVDWHILSLYALADTAAVICIIFFISMALTTLLLAPVRSLSRHLTNATADLKNLKDISPLPPNLVHQSEHPWLKADDFSGLIQSVQRLVDRINTNYRLTRSWSFQMAHELKTPLTLIGMEVDSFVKNGRASPELADKVSARIDHVSGIITQFLDWGDLENSSQPSNLSAVNLAQRLRHTKERYESIFPGRLHLTITHEPKAFANSVHVDQVLDNLVLNALKYSPSQCLVQVYLELNSLRIIDRGEGIPSHVMARLGQPFNFGNKGQRSKLKSSGLGLAWASSISKIYGWAIDFKTSSSGTEVTIRFPSAAQIDSSA